MRAPPALGKRICRGCGAEHASADAALGPWALLDVAAPTGFCRVCAGDAGWSMPLLQFIGTDRHDEGLRAHMAALERSGQHG